MWKQCIDERSVSGWGGGGGEFVYKSLTFVGADKGAVTAGDGGLMLCSVRVIYQIIYCCITIQAYFDKIVLNYEINELLSDDCVMTMNFYKTLGNNCLVFTDGNRARFRFAAS